jgi:hypothetical protein
VGFANRIHGLLHIEGGDWIDGDRVEDFVDDSEFSSRGGVAEYDWPVGRRADVVSDGVVNDVFCLVGADVVSEQVLVVLIGLDDVEPRHVLLIIVMLYNVRSVVKYDNTPGDEKPPEGREWRVESRAGEKMLDRG